MTLHTNPSSIMIPLAVDLDGTLLNTDTLLESLCALIRENLFYIFLIPFWLGLSMVRGKGFFKHQVARRVHLDVTSLPYFQPLLSYIVREHQTGRQLMLVTAAEMGLAQKIADHLGIFSEVIATHGSVNMKGIRKRDVLIEKYGEKGFDYAGNERVDLKVWAHANSAIVVTSSERLVRQVRNVAIVNQVFRKEGFSLSVFLKAIRLKQWVKNLLIFVPLITAHKVFQLNAVVNSLIAFFAFSLMASGVYLINDLMDIESDRHHSEKKHRPFASGQLSILAGIAGVPILGMASFFLSLWLPGEFLLVLFIYFVTTIGYSFYFKKIVLVDVICLASLYTLRIFSGSMATGIVISQWLFAFSLFFFVSLAFVKRYSELYALRRQNKEISKGRGYLAGDLEQLATMGSANGYIAVLVFALYINSAEVKNIYSFPAVLWFICPLLLYWISRIWFKAHRGEVQEDPIVFAIRDKITYVVGMLIAAIIIFASIGIGGIGR